MVKSILRIAAYLLVLLSSSIFAREVTDMAGRTVAIPEQVKRVFGSAPPLNVLLHSLAPERMIGLSFKISKPAKKFYSSHLQSLPIIGGAFGFGKSMNPEEVLALKPDLALAWQPPILNYSKTEEAFASIGIPVIFLKLDVLADWPTALRFTGKLLALEERAEARATYIENAVAKLSSSVSALPYNQRLRVYYAEGPDGLATDCHRSLHAETIELAGGYNVYRCDPKDHKGMEKISIEQILAFDPEVIIVQNHAALSTIRDDARWQGISAVKTNRIHAVPRWPYNWLDRPPSLMRALGAQWLANLFYPDRYPLDIKQETQKFYQLFFNVTLSDAETNILLNP
ncbi:MAG: ABC transporter substrate-binding protein [Candidatus Thiodiazotropha sp.]|jgi:iron complex transport system substrate-binding protein